jgi:hypothetical protein
MVQMGSDLNSARNGNLQSEPQSAHLWTAIPLRGKLWKDPSFPRMPLSGDIVVLKELLRL